MSQFFTTLTKDELRDMLREEINLLKKNEDKETSQLKNQDEFLTVQEACNLLRISKPTLYKRMEDGTINSKRMGSRILFNRAELINTINKSGGK